MSRLHARRQFIAAGLSIALAVPVAAIAAPTAVAGEQGDSNFVLLKRGSEGPRVKLVQRTLDVKTVNGNYNRVTRNHVKRFQDSRSIEVTGVVNERTMKGIRAKWENIQDARKRWNAKYDRILRIARAQKGDPYRYGAAGPTAFDCSGLTMFVYRKATNMNLEHRATSQFRKGDRISRKQARPGDLVFMYDGGGIYHAAIYAGRGDIIHASTPGTNVKRDPIWTNNVLFARMFKKP